MNSIGYRTVTWIGRDALILAAVMLASVTAGGNLVGALLFVLVVPVPIAGICAAVRTRMLERRLAVERGERLAASLMSDASDPTQQMHPLPWKR